MLLRARSAKTDRKTENRTEWLCPLQRSVLPDVLELRRQNGREDGPSVGPLMAVCRVGGLSCYGVCRM
jgi:hypothetical protein